MQYFDDLSYTFNWLLDTSQSDAETRNPLEWRLPWNLDILKTDEFMAELKATPEEFLIRISDCVWPRLVAFAACGIAWKGNAAQPAGREFNYSQEEWQTIIRLTEGRTKLASLEPSLTRLKNNSLARKRIWSPLTVYAAHAMTASVVAANYGVLWLICHEGAHACKQHYRLQNIPFRESIRGKSELLAGLELDRTCEAEADWQASKFIYAHVLNCVIGGYSSALAYAAGFGTLAAILMLNPSRHGLWERAGQHDPGWMRAHCSLEAAKDGAWWIVDSNYPDYCASLRQLGSMRTLHNFKGKAPTKYFNKASDRTLMSFYRGQHDALRFAHAIGDANGLYHVVDGDHWNLGDPHEWKPFQSMVLETEVLEKRRKARAELGRLLPDDIRFRKAGPLGYGAMLKLNFLASTRRRLRKSLARKTAPVQ